MSTHCDKCGQGLPKLTPPEIEDKLRTLESRLASLEAKVKDVEGRMVGWMEHGY